jgi:hypothetical protein
MFMEVRKSSLLRFTDLMAVKLEQMAQQHPQVNISLDVMHSRIKTVERITRTVAFISPETGTMCLFWHDAPDAEHYKMLFVCTSAKARSGESVCWMCRIPFVSITTSMSRETLARWIIEVFMKLTFSDNNESFMSKMKELMEFTEGPLYTKFGDFHAFYHDEFEL